MTIPMKMIPAGRDEMLDHERSMISCSADQRGQKQNEQNQPHTYIRTDKA